MTTRATTTTVAARATVATMGAMTTRTVMTWWHDYLPPIVNISLVLSQTPLVYRYVDRVHNHAYIPYPPLEPSIYPLLSV